MLGHLLPFPSEAGIKALFADGDDELLKEKEAEAMAAEEAAANATVPPRRNAEQKVVARLLSQGWCATSAWQVMGYKIFEVHVSHGVWLAVYCRRVARCSDWGLKCRWQR